MGADRGARRPRDAPRARRSRLASRGGSASNRPPAAAADASPRCVCPFSSLSAQGYTRGSEEALARIDDEVTRQARAAYAAAIVEEEARKGASVEQEASRLGKAYYR